MALISTVPLTSSFKYSKPMVSQTLQTLAEDMDDDEGPRNCLIHLSGSHTLEDCRVFKGMSLEDKKKGINGNLICYIYLGEHKLSDCTLTSQKCKKCGSKRHHTLFHSYLPKKSLKIKTLRLVISLHLTVLRKPSHQTVLMSRKRRYLLLSAPQSVGYKVWKKLWKNSFG